MRFAVSTLPALLGTRAARLFLALAAALASLPARTETPPQAKPQEQVKQVKEDVKGATRAADRADKAASAGKVDEALAEYQNAVRLAPGDIGIKRRAARLKAQVVQKIVDQAES